MKKLIFAFVGIALGLSFSTLSAIAQNTDTKMVDAGVVNSKAVDLVKPEYPPAARAVNAGGAVNVEVIIDEKGSVVSTKILSGHPLLRAASEKAARESKFSPTLYQGQPVKARGTVVFNFYAGSDKTPADSKSIDGEIRGGILNQRARLLPIPEYPQSAKDMNAGGTVMVRVTVDEEGNVISASAISGHPLLKEAALNAAKEAKFPPTLLEDKPVKVTGMLVYNFATENDVIKAGVLNGRAKNLIKPEYPKEAREAKIEGTVNVQITIDENGNVMTATAVSGPDMLREVSEKAARDSKFAPSYLSGRPVKVSGVLVYNFVSK